MRIGKLELTRLALVLGLACAMTYIAGNRLAFAFPCTETGCSDWAEGVCMNNEGVWSEEFENPTCKVTCNDGTRESRDCDDV